MAQGKDPTLSFHDALFYNCFYSIKVLPILVTEHVPQQVQELLSIVVDWFLERFLLVLVYAASFISPSTNIIPSMTFGMSL